MTVLPPPRNDPDQILAALDPEQRAVATAPVGPVMVLAGAGTGKTRAVTHRIAYQAATGAMDPRRVLALTFTTRAAGEMRQRLRELGAGPVQARTFHSAALRQAMHFWPKIHRQDLPPVVDNRYRLVAEAARGLQLATDTAIVRDLLGEISWSKVSNVLPEQYPTLARQAGRELAAADPESVARVFQRYEDLKQDRGIDFEDILLCTVSLLSEYQEVAEAVRAQYQHFVVDEYQDTSPLQQALLDLWLGPRNSVCVVGDPAQTIHSFAGARAEYLMNFPTRHPGATQVRLVRDYRSTPQVVRAANTVLRRGPGQRGHLELVAQRENGPAPRWCPTADENAEAEEVARWLSARHDEGVPWSEMAVLFRINAQSPVLEQALGSAGIPYLVRGGEKFYERSEVRHAMGLLRAQARTQSVVAAELGLTEPLEVARAVLEIAGWQPEAPAGAGQVRERWESLAALWAAVQEVMDPGCDFGLLVGRLEERAASQHVPQADGVTLATLHSAKGLEWDAVAIVGAQEGTLPFILADTPEQLAEERRLFYVGITRARIHLLVTWAVTRSGGGRERRPSRFLDGLRPADPAHQRSTSGGQRSRRRTLERCRTCGRVLNTGAERKLGRHEECPSTYDEALLDRLKEWRKKEADERSLPAYCVFTDATLMAIAESGPTTPLELLQIRGIGKAKADRYATAVLAVLADDD